MPREHPLDGVADELAQWLESESKWYAGAIKGDYAAPFAAKASESEKLEYYRRQFYTQEPDGTINYEKPNLQGRQALIQRIGIDQRENYASRCNFGWCRCIGCIQCQPVWSKRTVPSQPLSGAGSCY